MEAVRSARVVSGGTLLSRAFGLVRDVVLAHTLGAGAVADAFAIAFRTPNLLREVVGEGALTSAFLPSYAGRVAAGDEPGARRLYRSVVALLLAVLTGITVLVIAAVNVVPVGRLAAEDPEKVALILDLTAWCFPYAILVCLSALFAAVLQAEGKFGIPALAPAVMNIGWILGMLGLLHAFPDTAAGRGHAVAGGVLIGGVLQALVALPLLRRLDRWPIPSLTWKDTALQGMLKRMAPAVLGLAPVQVNLLVNALIAEALVPGDGANSALYYSSRLLQLPLALVGVSVGVASFPLFARLAALGRKHDLGNAVAGSLRATTFVSLPAAAGLAVLALPATTVLFRHGRFSTEDAEAAAAVLRFALIGLPAFCGLHILTRAFHASNDTTTPVRIGGWAVAVNFALNLALVGPMEERGLAFSTALVAWGNLAALVWIARHRHRLRGLRTVAGTALRGAGLAAAAGLAAWGALEGVAAVLPGDTFVPTLVRLVAAVAAGGLMFIGASIGLRVPDALELQAALLHRKRHGPDHP